MSNCTIERPNTSHFLLKLRRRRQSNGCDQNKQIALQAKMYCGQLVWLQYSDSCWCCTGAVSLTHLDWVAVCKCTASIPVAWFCCFCELCFSQMYSFAASLQRGFQFDAFPTRTTWNHMSTYHQHTRTQRTRGGASRHARWTRQRRTHALDCTISFIRTCIMSDVCDSHTLTYTHGRTSVVWKKTVPACGFHWLEWIFTWAHRHTWYEAPNVRPIASTAGR